MTSCQAVAISPWTDGAIIVTALGALVFVVSYASMTRGGWSRTSVGWNVMALMAVIMVVSGLAVATIVWGTDWPHRELVRFLAWAFVAGCVWWRVAILWKVQHED